MTSIIHISSKFHTTVPGTISKDSNHQRTPVWWKALPQSLESWHNTSQFLRLLHFFHAVFCKTILFHIISTRYITYKTILYTPFNTTHILFRHLPLKPFQMCKYKIQSGSSIMFSSMAKHIIFSFPV